MRAARMFLDEMNSATFAQTARIKVELYGSLAHTGRGHGTDRAILLGLLGERPEEVDPSAVEGELAGVRTGRSISLLRRHTVSFDEARDVLFHHVELLPLHSNGMRFTAIDASGNSLASGVYYSVGGGFVVKEGSQSQAPQESEVPFPFNNGEDLLLLGNRSGKSIAAMILANETCWRNEDQIHNQIIRIWDVMQACVRRGLSGTGELPGGLNVQRRAARLHTMLTENTSDDPMDIMDWVNLYAIAVNEENAAGGQVVTAPTNGAAGIIPAVLHYYHNFCKGASHEGIERFFLTAGAIGILYKENASISGAEVGCQGEVGVACSMAAAGLAAALGSTNEQAEHAAEIGMEHHLGMTCDPVGGLVQIPCIERNALGAVKAINSARIAMRGDGRHRVSLDQVINTMYQTGLDMQARYKETSQAGLAVHVVKC
jgi:L-serine dehydratase